jgi:hypothetical protein
MIIKNKCEFLMEHSQNAIKNYKKTQLLLLAFLLFFFVAGEVDAQMFSVGKAPGRIDIPQTAVYLGVEPAEFDYTGGTLSNPILQDRFSFNGTLIRLEARFQGLEAFMATGGSLTGIDDVSYFDAGIKVGYGFSIVRSETLTLQIPLQVMSGITNVTSDRNSAAGSPQFRQGALTIGAGGFVGLRPARSFRVQAEFIPSYGFSFATGGTFGGSLGKLEGKLRLFFDRLFGSTGLSVGYNYKSSRFDVDANEYDYDLQAHSLLLGITF